MATLIEKWFWLIVPILRCKFKYDLAFSGSGEIIDTATVILTTGTFLRGVINIGRYVCRW